jgi:hypothetical protein
LRESHTPNTQVALTRPGLYRIEVAADSSTTKVGVREGEGFVALANGQQQALPGQMVSVSGIEPLAADFPQWASASTASTPGVRTVIVTMSAHARRLTCRGRWSVSSSSTHTGAGNDNPTYGAVWYPRRSG